MAGNRSFSGLPPQRAGIQRQNKNQRKSGDFVHKADLEQSGFANILPLQSRFCNHHLRSATGPSLLPKAGRPLRSQQGAKRCVLMIANHLQFFRLWLLSCCYSDRNEVALVKTLQRWAAIFGHSPCIKRMTKISFGLIAAVFLLQFYYGRELLFAEVFVALGFVVVALIGALYVLGHIAVLWLWKLGSEPKALGALVSARHRQPFAKTTTTGLSEAKEEVS